MIIINKHTGFTLIELVVVIVILGILSTVALPKFIDVSSSARAASLTSVAGAMKSTIKLVKTKAFIQGITPDPSNPGVQSKFLVDFGHGSAEIDWRNLCPESRAELGDKLAMVDFLTLDASDLISRQNNQYTLVGYDIPAGYSVPTDQGCYIIYDSFGNPDCTVTVVTEDC